MVQNPKLDSVGETETFLLVIPVSQKMNQEEENVEVFFSDNTGSIGS